MLSYQDGKLLSAAVLLLPDGVLHKNQTYNSGTSTMIVVKFMYLLLFRMASLYSVNFLYFNLLTRTRQKRKDQPKDGCQRGVGNYLTGYK